MSKLIETYYNSRTRVIWHILFWMCYLAAHTTFYGSPDGAYREEFLWALRNLPFKMVLTYFILYVVIPRFLLKKSYLKALLVFVGAVATAVLLQQGINYAVVYPLFHPEWESEYLFYSSKMYTVFLGMYPVVTIAACIKLLKHWYEKEAQAKELRQKKLEAELQFLKTQVHPHFLFNTLNNLYALTLKKSDNASDVVLKLSDLMNYMLYECGEPTVPLDKELDITETYIELEKIRYGDRLSINFEITGATEGKKIPPMLILPFVENSFKHGVNASVREAWIHISIASENNRFTLKVANSCPNSVAAQDVRGGDNQNGIGLENVKQRLQLLYGNNYQLEVKRNRDSFSVALALDLHQSVKPEA